MGQRAQPWPQARLEHFLCAPYVSSPLVFLLPFPVGRSKGRERWHKQRQGLKSLCLHFPAGNLRKKRSFALHLLRRGDAFGHTDTERDALAYKDAREHF